MIFLHLTPSFSLSYISSRSIAISYNQWFSYISLHPSPSLTSLPGPYPYHTTSGFPTSHSIPLPLLHLFQVHIHIIQPVVFLHLTPSFSLSHISSRSIAISYNQWFSYISLHPSPFPTSLLGPQPYHTTSGSPTSHSIPLSWPTTLSYSNSTY